MERDKFNKRNLSLESELESQLQADPSFDYDTFESVLGRDQAKSQQQQNKKRNRPSLNETMKINKDLKIIYNFFLLL